MRTVTCVPGLTVVAFVASLQQPPLQVSHRARAVAPGEVVLVEISAPLPLQDVRAEWLGQTLMFFQSGPGRWRGLAPIDLAAVPGRQTLTVTAVTSDGRKLSHKHPIVVAARTFPARRISVDPKFADPPADAMPRIEQERKTVEALFARATPERFWADPFIVPVPGEATSSFGRRTILNGQPRGQHSGTDFKAGDGTPVAAPNRGRVVLAADHYFAGRTIIIDHGLGLYSYLAHLSELGVAEGALVERGQQVALSGSSGRVTGPHLHWTMRVGRARVDPLSLVEILGKAQGSRPSARQRGRRSGAGRRGPRERRRWGVRRGDAPRISYGAPA